MGSALYILWLTWAGFTFSFFLADDLNSFDKELAKYVLPIMPIGNFVLTAIYFGK